ncbi:DUF885 family protein [Engelhardtia mirabilis]|uniref:X-Pro dipeptidyl-peptidase n=1 Tax=Engelhardtia mirabilis TaxID=2528011 RepID=A0A518BET5_9BACT|nr:hypothetical protein Pla133_05410 [Planctomycetes bacterium Pla133]QDU99802.1 hypothetical protein Pla86_05410 [Planctomycetes bacterium Pla86]
MISCLLAVAALQSPAPAPIDLRARIEHYEADRSALWRRYAAPLSTERAERLTAFERGVLAELDALDYDALGVDQRVDWHLLRDEALASLAGLELEHRRDSELAELIPFAERLVPLFEARQRVDPVDGSTTAHLVDGVGARIDEVQAAVDAGEFDALTAVVAGRAAGRIDDLGWALREWYDFRAGYDPLFTWWLAQPKSRVAEGLEDLARTLRERLIEADDGADATLVGDPIGREALLAALEREFIPYSPAELIELARTELAWCDARMAESARALGFGDDWRAAQAHVKSLHAEPGAQPELVRHLVEEAIDFVTERDLVTVPPLCAETWRMTMLSPERQRVSPYFLGGELMQVSFPTDAMTDGEKRATLAGNNEHFSRAVAHHEVIPGHHLQGFMQQRFMPHRRLFSTPFWVEGWALYWEMRLWDLGFPRGPEDRIGMLFWRRHRCARVIFSLSFHLGEMTAPQCVDFLVENVGHERDNAEAEVRRSVGGDYGPLYQAAYMIGGLQFRALHRELVLEGEWEERAFHDAVLQRGSIPIELLRASLLGRAPERELASSWRFGE